jgi:hypothetical protein
MKSKNYQRFFKASTFTMLAISLVLVGHIACQENEADETPFNGNSSDVVVNNAVSNDGVASSKFHERVGAQIPLEVAMRWKAAYKKENEGHAESHFFGTAIFRQMLSQPNVAGINIEYALNDEGVPQLLLVAVDKNGHVMNSSSDNGYADASIVCPPSCPN